MGVSEGLILDLSSAESTTAVKATGPEVNPVGAAGIEIASLLSKSNKGNGVAPPPHSNWSLLEPTRAKLSALSVFDLC